MVLFNTNYISEDSSLFTTHVLAKYLYSKFTMKIDYISNVNVTDYRSKHLIIVFRNKP